MRQSDGCRIESAPIPFRPRATEENTMVTRKPAAKTAAKTARKTAASMPAETASSADAPSSDAAKGKSKAMPALPSFADLGKMVEKFKLPGIDVNAIVESQRKDMEALAEANRQAYEGIKALAQRRNEILQEALVQWQDAMKDATGKDAMSKRAEMAKKGVQQAIANFRELAEMEAQSRGKAWKVLQDRFQENVANLQKLLKPK
jgi:phasin family protein